PSSGPHAIVRYEVYRDDVRLGSVVPGFHPDFPEKDGNGYIDATATPGVSYGYQVKAVDAHGAESPASSVLRLSLPATTTPPPTIALDSSEVADLSGWLEGTARPF